MPQRLRTFVYLRDEVWRQLIGPRAGMLSLAAKTTERSAASPIEARAAHTGIPIATPICPTDGEGGPWLTIVGTVTASECAEVRTFTISSHAHRFEYFV